MDKNKNEINGTNQSISGSVELSEEKNLTDFNKTQKNYEFINQINSDKEGQKYTKNNNEIKHKKETIDLNNQTNKQLLSNEKSFDPNQTYMETENNQAKLSSLSVNIINSLDESSNHVLDKNNVLTDDSHLKTDESDNSIQEYPEHFSSSRKLDKNLKFYQGKIKSKPNGDYIDEILKWPEDLLEIHHGFIQWLFPNRDPGMNLDSQPLQQEELEIMKNDKKIVNKLKKAFQVMLKFYGMEISSENFCISRAKNFKERYNNLKKNSHNFLRITRILKCLAEFELVDLQYQWIEFLIHEIFLTKKLCALEKSMKIFFVETVKDKEKRNYFIKKIKMNTE